MVQKSLTNLDLPEYAVPVANLVPTSAYPANMQKIPPSRMFTIKLALDKYREKAGADAAIFDASQGDGGASLPGVPREILEAALELQIQHGSSYDKPYGTDLFRKVTAEQYWQFEASTGFGPENIIFVQGGRDGLQKAYEAMIALGNQRKGDLLMVSRVPWISYNWEPYAVGLNVLRAPGRPEEGWRYTPEAIEASVDFAQQDGRNIAGMIITSPDNPTGRTIPVEEQIQLAKVALASGVSFVLFDWIYHYVNDTGTPSDINAVLNAFSPAERERLLFLDGLTKSLGASNIRSAHLVAGKEVVKFINSQASHGVIPSFYSQAVAIAAYQKGFAEAAATIIKPTAESRKILRAALEAEAAPFIMGDGYYAFVDMTQYIEAGGYKNTEDLGGFLAEEHGVAVVPGVYFSDAGENWIRFSYAQTPEKTAGAVERLFSGAKSLL